MYGAAMPMGAFPMQAWPPHMMPPGFPMDMGAGMGPVAGEHAVLKLKGLPFAATAQDVSAFFDGFSPLSCTIHHGADGRPSGMVRQPVLGPTARETLSTPPVCLCRPTPCSALPMRRSVRSARKTERLLANASFGYCG